MFETRLLSSLIKVFADEELQDQAVKTGSCLRGEVSFAGDGDRRSVYLSEGLAPKAVLGHCTRAHSW